MRARVLRPLIVAAILGAVAGALVALAGQWWVSRDTPPEFTFVSYAPLPDGPTSVSLGLAPSWWPLLWPAALAGVVVAVLGALVFSRTGGASRPVSSGWRGLWLVAATGVVLGGAVGTTLYLRAGASDDLADSGGQVTYHGRYVPLPGIDMQQAYGSTLSITLDRQPQNAPAFFAVCAATGLACGLVAGGVVLVARRRRA